MAIEYKKEGRIAIFTINRPEKMNALNAEAYQELIDTMTDFQDDPELWVGIITGAGERAFSAGHDVGGTPAPTVGSRPGPPASTLLAAYHLPAKISKPFVAAINGWALGGGLELALACDIRIASENARFGLPEIRTLAGLAGAGGPQRLPRFIPRGIASWMLLTGQPIDAQEAYRVGLVNKVVPLDQLMPAAKQMAETICEAAPLSAKIAKEVIIRGSEMSIEQALQLQHDLFSRYAAPEDRMEARKAFAEKRKPVWKGK